MITYKIADTEEELKQICELNYKTFVEEIPQHEQNETRSLTDRFHAENTYIIGKEDDRVVAMLALRGRRPFSLDEKLKDLETYLPPHKRMPVEVRLLSVMPAYRNSTVFKSLIRTALRHAVDQGFDIGVISGTLRQQKLYRHLGFIPFGPVVGRGEALFQPMYMIEEPVFREKEPLSFLPGPVKISEAVRDAYSMPLISHRSPEFKKMLKDVQSSLKNLTGASYASLFLGSGTLANDVVAGQISLLKEPGLILSNGEFGERLFDHANRFSLIFKKQRYAWGQSFNLTEVEEKLKEARWVWFVHSESSTSHLNDLETMLALTSKHHTKVCIDAVSSLGSIPLDLSRIYLASSVSGKCLGSYPGLALVFSNQRAFPHQTLPRYLDLGLYQEAEDIPFTQSSSLLASLQAALTQLRVERFEAYQSQIKDRLSRWGITPLLSGQEASPAILTFPFPQEISTEIIGDSLKQKGILVYYEGAYLKERNWIQIVLYGALSQQDIHRLLNTLDQILTHFEQQKRSSARA